MKSPGLNHCKVSAYGSHSAGIFNSSTQIIIIGIGLNNYRRPLAGMIVDQKVDGIPFPHNLLRGFFEKRGKLFFFSGRGLFEIIDVFDHVLSYRFQIPCYLGIIPVFFLHFVNQMADGKHGNSAVEAVNFLPHAFFQILYLANYFYCQIVDCFKIGLNS